MFEDKKDCDFCFVKDCEEAYYPKRSTKYSAGYDFYAVQDTIIEAHEIMQVHTGIKARFPNNYGLFLFSRSSTCRKGLFLANGVGVVDSDYYGNKGNGGEISFLYYNFTDEDIKITRGEKIGQGVFLEYHKVDDDIASGTRVGGFGSTGN